MVRKTRGTRQKEHIGKELSSFKGFFSAEDLFNKVRQKHPTIGIATIYRFLAELSKKQELHTYTCNRRMIYTLHKLNHCHFICERCGEVTHFDVKSLDALSKEIRGEICHFQIDVTGTCQTCLRKSK